VQTERRSRPAAALLERAVYASAAWHFARTTEELADLVCRSLRELIPCDAAGWNEIDLDGQIVRFHNDPELDVPIEALNGLIASHPLLRHALETGDIGPHAISDFLDEKAFHRTRIYREVYRQMGVEDQLATGVEVAGGSVVAVALNRSERGFSDVERRLLDLVRPHLAAAHRRLSDRATVLERVTALEQGLEQAGHTLVSTRADGRLGELTEGARKLLTRWFGEVPARLEPGDYEQPGGVLVVTETDGLLLLDEHRFVSDSRAAEHGLTARETEVVALAARGLTNRAIGERLSISARTVHKHFENVYAKLGVRTRAAALAMLVD
jgi:DNA-binding CsgD family transcriptional regulator